MRALRERYDTLVARWKERWPDEVPPPFPDDSDLNAQVNINQVLVARLLGRPPIQIVTRQEPVLVPLKGEPPDGG